MEDLSKNILEKIKQEDIKPKSKFGFLAKNYAFWVAAIFSVLIGALTFAAILFILLNQDLMFFMQARGNSLRFILVALPYFWFAIFSVFIVLAYYNVKHVERGYKFSLPIIIGAYFVFTILLGSLFYTFGIGEYTENMFVQNVPFYGNMVERRQIMWHVPENGLIMGRVIEFDTGKKILLLDMKQEKWNVDITDAVYPPHMMIRKEMMIKVLGEVSGDHMFYAHEIRPHMLPMKIKGMMR